MKKKLQQLNEAQITEKQNMQVRWCSKREQWIAVSVCRMRAEKYKLCKKCMAKWWQLSLFDL